MILNEYDKSPTDNSLKPRVFPFVWVIREQPYIDEGKKIIGKWSLLWFAILQLFRKDK